MECQPNWAKWSTMRLAVHDVATQTESNRAGRYAIGRQPARAADRVLEEVVRERSRDEGAAEFEDPPRPARKWRRELCGQLEPHVVREVEGIREVSDVAERAGREHPGDRVALATDSGPYEERRAAHGNHALAPRIHACRVELDQRHHDQRDRDRRRRSVRFGGADGSTHGQPWR